MNINKNFEKIINPEKDFLVINDILKNKEYTKAVYDKIFAEIVLFIKKMNKITLQSCNLRKKSKSSHFIGKINFSTTKNQYLIVTVFDKNIVEIFINGKSIGESTIFGANINKLTIVVDNIKVDIATFKQDLSEIINI
jgi:hypothetical protein